MPDDSTTQLQVWIDAIGTCDKEGSRRAREGLLQHAYQRLRRLARHILHQDFLRLVRFDDTDDVAQMLYLRLHKRLSRVEITDTADFFQFAAKEIRWLLLDQVKSRFGPRGCGRNEAPLADIADSNERFGAVAQPGTDTHDPVRLALWTELHERIDQLPELEREVFHLKYILGLTHPQVACQLGLSVDAVKGHWLKVKVRLAEFLPFFSAE